MQLRRGLKKLLEARQDGLQSIFKKAMQEGPKRIDADVAQVFQHAHRAQRENRIFLEVCFCTAPWVWKACIADSHSNAQRTLMHSMGMVGRITSYTITSRGMVPSHGPCMTVAFVTRQQVLPAQ